MLLTSLTAFAIVTLMNLDTYLNENETGASLAKRLGVHASLVSQWRTGVRPIPEIWCVVLERETGKLVTRKDTRPKDWHLIWPELADIDCCRGGRVAAHGN